MEPFTGHKNAEWHSGTKRFRTPDPKTAFRRNAERQFVEITFSPYELCKFSRILSWRFCEVKRTRKINIRNDESPKVDHITTAIVPGTTTVPPRQRQLWNDFCERSVKYYRPSRERVCYPFGPDLFLMLTIRRNRIPSKSLNPRLYAKKYTL